MPGDPVGQGKGGGVFARLYGSDGLAGGAHGFGQFLLRQLVLPPQLSDSVLQTITSLF